MNAPTTVPMPNDSTNCADCSQMIPIGHPAIQVGTDAEWVHADLNGEYCLRVCYICGKDCTLTGWDAAPSNEEVLCDECANSHTKDSDCTVDTKTNLCTGCGADHSEPCPECGRKAFHTATCGLVDNGNTNSTKREEFCECGRWPEHCTTFDEPDGPHQDR